MDVTRESAAGRAAPVTASPARFVSRPGVGAVAVWLPLLVFLGFAVLWPLISLEIQSFSGGGLENYRDALSHPNIGRTIAYTVALAIADVIVAVIVGTLLAWCSLHLPPRLQTVGSVIPLMPLLVPGVAAVMGWIFLLSPGVGYLNTILRYLPLFGGLQSGPLDIYTFTGMVFVSGLIFSAFVFLFVVNGLRNAGAEYEEAAAVSGASPLRIFMTVTLPQLRPSLAYGSGIVFMLALGQFAVPILLGGPANINVITTQMFRMLEGYPIPFGEIAALGTPLLLTGAIVLVGQGLLIGDMRRYVTSSGKPQFSPRQPRGWAVAAIAIYTLLAVVLPLVALTYSALSPFWTRELSFNNLTLRNFSAVFGDPYLMSAVYTSVLASVATILIVLPVGYLAARLLAGRVEAPPAVRKLIDFLLLLPYAVPATLLGFAMLFAYTQKPFQLYGTQTIIIVAYCTIMIPYSTRFLLATLMSLGQEPWEASSVSGAGTLRTFFKVTVPLMRKSAITASAIIFILLFQEFAVSLLVRSASVQVIGSVLYDQYSGGTYPKVAVLSLFMVAITALGVGLMFVFGGAETLRSGGGGKIDLSRNS